MQAAVFDPNKGVPPVVLSETGDGRLVFISPSGILQLENGRDEPYQIPGVSRSFFPTSLLRDRDGGLWIGTLEKGLLHVRTGGADVFSRADGLSSNSVRAIFEDREGNVWVSTSRRFGQVSRVCRIDLFRRAAFAWRRMVSAGRA